MDQELQEKFDEIKAKITPESVTRMVVKGIAKHSVAFVASQLVKTYVPTENKKQELQLQVGTYVVAGMAGDRAADWAEHQIDEAIEFVKGLIKAVSSKTSEEEAKPQEESLSE